MSAIALLLLALGAGQEAPIATVTVSAAKPRVAAKLDKTVHEVADTPKAANGSAQDVLQALLEVSVTADGRIAVKGNAQVTVLVDGKPAAALAGEERAVALQTMSGADIASVEVISNPSAAHNANGGAILNIVLKRERKPGARAQLRGSVSDQSLWNAGVSGDLTRGAVSVHGSLALRHDGNRKRRRAELDWLAPGGTRHTLQTSSVFVRRTVATAALGADYAPSAADTFSLSVRYNERRSRPLLDTFNLQRGGGAETMFHRISYGPNEQSDHSASLGYSRRGEGTALKAALQRSETDGLVDKSYRDVFVDHLGEHGRSATRSARRLDQASVDWSRTSDGGQWGAGLDWQDEVNALSNDQAAVDPVTGAATPDPGTTHAYAVATTLSAAYLTDRIRHGKWEALLGARLERIVQRVGAAHSRTQSIQPSVHLRYAVGEAGGLTFSYRRSLPRPDPRDLNPFTTYIDALNRSRGNPDLAPQRLSAWEIGAGAETGPLSGSIGAFYRASRDTVVDARSIDAGGVLLTSKQNGGQARSLGVTGSLDWTLNGRVRLGTDGGAYRLTLDTTDLVQRVHQTDVAGYANFRAAYSQGEDDVTLDAHVQSAAITPLGRHGASSSVNLSWKRRLTRTLSVTLNAGDLFDGSRRTWRMDASAIHQAGVDHVVARRIYLGLVKKIE